MALEPPSSPGAPGPSGEPVKRAAGDDGPVPLRWLAEVEFRNDADRLDRLIADVDLVTSLALAGYEGRDWDVFSTELAKYGMAVIRAWMAKGSIFEKCRSRGFGGLPSPEGPFTDDELEELTGETVATALRHFREDVLLRNRWDARRGATLRTFFIGQCILRFSNVYRRWWGNESRSRLSVPSGHQVGDVAQPGWEDPARDGVDRAVITGALSRVRDPRVRRAMVLTAHGATQAEIALEHERPRVTSMFLKQLGVCEKSLGVLCCCSSCFEQLVTSEFTLIHPHIIGTRADMRRRRA